MKKLLLLCFLLIPAAFSQVQPSVQGPCGNRQIWVQTWQGTMVCASAADSLASYPPPDLSIPVTKIPSSCRVGAMVTLTQTDGSNAVGLYYCFFNNNGVQGLYSVVAGGSGCTLGGVVSGQLIYNNAGACATATTTGQDTNVPISVTGGNIAITWTGTLAKARIISSAVYNDQSNTWSTGTQSFAAAQHFIAFNGTVAAKPATCTVGEIYFATDATAGQNWYFCTSTNVWTQQLNSGGSGCTLGGVTSGQLIYNNAGVCATAIFTNDTNVTASVTGGNVTLGWTGTLAKARIISSAVYNDQSNTYTTGTQNFGAAQHFIAFNGTTAGKPATCTVGEVYFATDATAGQNWFFCTATNTWTQQLNSGGGSNPGLCAQGNITGTVSINLTGCTLITATLTGNVTSLTFTNATSGQTAYGVQFYQDATGSRTVTGVTGVNNFPCLIPTASKVTSFSMWYDGTNLWVTNSNSNAGFGCAPNGTTPALSPPSGQIFSYIDPSLTVPAYKNSFGNKINLTGAVLSDTWPVGDTIACPNNTLLGTGFATVATIPAFEVQGNQYVVDLDLKLVGVSGGPYQFYYGYYGAAGTTSDTQVGNFQGGTPGSSVTSYNHISIYLIAATAPSASASLLVTASPGNFGLTNVNAISGNTVATDPITALATNVSNKFTLAFDCATNASGSAQLLHETVRRVY